MFKQVTIATLAAVSVSAIKIKHSIEDTQVERNDREFNEGSIIELNEPEINEGSIIENNEPEINVDFDTELDDTAIFTETVMAQVSYPNVYGA